MIFVCCCSDVVSHCTLRCCVHVKPKLNIEYILMAKIGHRRINNLSWKFALIDFFHFWNCCFEVFY